MIKMCTIKSLVVPSRVSYLKITSQHHWEIDFIFHLLSKNDFEETKQTLVINAAIGLHFSLSRNPAKFGNLTQLQVEVKDTWVPWISLQNNADDLKPLGSYSDFPVNIYNDGSIIYTLKAKCDTYISKFPFDTQMCSLQFVSWTSDNTLFKFSSSRSEVYRKHFKISSVWELTNNSVEAIYHGGHTEYCVTLTLKWRSTYFAWMVVVPAMLLCLLIPMVFFLPTESRQRVSFSMTVLLSYAVFLTMVSSSIPATSNPMCFLLALISVDSYL